GSVVRGQGGSSTIPLLHVSCQPVLDERRNRATPRFVVGAWRPALSSPSDGWHQGRRRCRRGNILKTAGGHAGAGPVETSPPRRSRAGAYAHHAGRDASPAAIALWTLPRE